MMNLLKAAVGKKIISRNTLKIALNKKLTFKTANHLCLPFLWTSLNYTPSQQSKPQPEEKLQTLLPGLREKIAWHLGNFAFINLTTKRYYIQLN